MEDYADSFSSTSYSQPNSPRPGYIKVPGSSSSRLTLVLPPLKSVLAARGPKKPKHRSGSTSFAATPAIQDVEVIEKKQPRPIKLKPLKEVLTKLISQIKKKDDYAFFLTPVDADNIPGYRDVVKNPMDLGTIADKVNGGKYRSLDEFTADFKLVTTNAKIFNPPGSIYHHEADRIETWGLDHINKAAGTVIQHESDWNIDIERDDDVAMVNVEDDDEDRRATPMDIDDQSRARSVSVVSQPQPGPSRRGPRGPYKKQVQAGSTTVTESMESDGRLPGSKDGIGAFPAGSDWAKLMLSLKLKGKKYRTKKERMRIEKEGPPMLADGSLDYSEMEDPFSVLSSLVPDPPSRPALTPLYPPLFSPIPTAQPVSIDQQQQQQSPSHGEEASQSIPRHSPFPAATSIPANHSLPLIQPDDSAKSNPRRHWTITRNITSRQKGKDKEDDPDISEPPSWQVPREPHASDFGSFALLAGELAEEMRRRGMTPCLVQEGQEQEINFDLLREDLDVEAALKRNAAADNGKRLDFARPQGPEEIKKTYWTNERAAEGEDYLRSLVYGSVDGLAYVRSLAQFLKYEPPEVDQENGNHVDATKPEAAVNTLGIPLSQWVEKNVVDPLTDGRHSLIRQTAMILNSHNVKNPPAPTPDQINITQHGVANQVSTSLNVYPVANAALATLLSISVHKIDMGALIKTPEELFLSEEEWYGKELKERRRQQGEEAKAKAAIEQEKRSDAMEVEEPEQTWVGVNATANKPAIESDYELEGPEELKEVLDYAAAVIVDLNKRNLAKNPPPQSQKLNGSTQVLKTSQSLSTECTVESPIPPTQVTAETPSEDPVLRNLRLNLLALAKRAPLDTIARLPKDLVPEHIRQYVPTLGSST